MAAREDFNAHVERAAELVELAGTYALDGAYLTAAERLDAAAAEMRKAAAIRMTMLAGSSTADASAA